MKKWMHHIEVIVDKAILPCLVLLIFIIIAELGFHDFVVNNGLEIYIKIIDYSIIFIFVLDLIFKYIKIHDMKKFIKLYWIDIIAVFPFFLAFRTYELISGAIGKTISETAHTAQTIVHEGLELEKEAKLAKLTRGEKFARFLRPLLRIPRFAKSIKYIKKSYDKPKYDPNKHKVRS